MRYAPRMGFSKPATWLPSQNGGGEKTLARQASSTDVVDLHGKDKCIFPLSPHQTNGTLYSIETIL